MTVTPDRRPAAAAAPHPDELVARAAALVPGLRARAEATDAARRVSDEVIAEMRTADLFAVLQPARYGGFELDLETFFRIVFELGRGCGSTAWVYSVCSMHQWQVGMFPDAAQKDVWGPDRQAVAASSFPPVAEAVPAEGGYRISGKWGFASGCDITEWFLLGVRFVDKAGGKVTETGFLLVPRADIEIDDNWHVVGLRGTGSKNVVAKDAFVPGHRKLTIAEAQSGASPGAEVNPGTLFHIPFFSAVASCLCAPVVGMAQGALDAYLDATRVRQTLGSSLGGGRTVAEFPTIQLRVAEAAAAIDAAKAVLLSDARELMATVQGGGELSVEQRVKFRRDHGYVVRLAAQAADRLFESAGGQALFDSHPVQRAWRNVMAASKHISLNWDSVGTLYGRIALGLDSGGAQF